MHVGLLFVNFDANQTNTQDIRYFFNFTSSVHLRVYAG